MKKILFRKLLFDYLTFLFIALFSASVVIWVFQAVNYLDIMIEDGRDYFVYLNFTLLNFPKIISKIFPFVLFFSLYYVMIKYELNNELMILWNFGIHKIQIINFFFLTSIFLTILQILFTSFIVPNSQDLARSFIRTSEVNFYENFVKPQKFNDTIKGVTIYTDKKDKNGFLNNLYIKKELNTNHFQITYASKGKFKEINNMPILVLYDGATITLKNKELTNISFSKSDFSLANFESNTTTYIKTQELSSTKIIKCINNYYKFNEDNFRIASKNIENCNVRNINNIFKEFYKRFIIPFYIPILSLLPFLLILISKENSKYQKLRVVTFLIGMVVIIFSETTIRFISQSITQNISLMSIPLILLIFIYLFLFKNFKSNLKSA
tara:strand:- start:1692 stop:2834 length:1143 start_codon:yes stop_codon:yes gene_type:complete